MRRFLWIVLIISLGLTGCTFDRKHSATSQGSSAEGSVSVPTVPASIEAPDAVFVPEAIPVLESEDGEIPRIRGPLGTVEAAHGLGVIFSDPVYADLDADGLRELIYACPGPTSGLYTVQLCAYGLEAGYPVLKALTVFNLPYGTYGLDVLAEEQGTIYFSWMPLQVNPGTGSVKPGKQERVALKLEGSRLIPADGKLPEGIAEWGSRVWYQVGMSLADLREKLAGKARYESSNCLIWEEWEPTAPAATVQRYAAVSDNGSTVTGLLTYGIDHCFRHGIDPIPLPQDLEALVNLFPAELEQQLGPCHFDDGSGVRLMGYLTDACKLLRIAASDRVLCVTLYDPIQKEILAEAGPLAGLHLGIRSEGEEAPSFVTWSDPAEPDVVTVADGNLTTVMVNQDRWEEFLRKSNGEIPDAVTLRIFYSSIGAADSLGLVFDGTAYHVNAEGRERVYSHLIIDDRAEPSPHANYKSAVLYLLSDDPDMTAEQYWSRMLSSALQPGFPNTTILFAVYSR